MDDSKVVYEVYLDLAKEDSLETISFIEFKDLFQFPVINMYKLLGFNTEPNYFSKFLERFHLLYESKLPSSKLHTETKDCLELIKNLEIPQSILSAHPHDFLLRDVEFHKLTNFFHQLNGISSKKAESKVQTGLNFIASLNTERDKILFIGDTDHDFEVANAMGVDCILIANGIQNKKILDKCNPKAIYNNLSEVFFDHS